MTYVVRRLVQLLSHPLLVAAALAFLFGTAAVALATFKVNDPDVFWLAAVGRDIVKDHAMPHVNGYSFADGSRPWVTHEGLFALVDFAGFRAAGPGFFTLLGLVARTATVFLGLAWIFTESRSAAAGALCSLILLSTERSFFVPRPLFAVLPLAVAMIIVVMPRGWSPARALGAVLVELVWTNAHGSFVLGLVLVAAGALEQGRLTRERRAWVLTAALVALVTLVNPYGWRLHGLVLRYVRGNDPTMAVIHARLLGFESLGAGIARGRIVGEQVSGLGVVAIAAVRALFRRKRVARAAVAMALVVMAVYHERDVAPAILLGGLLLLPDLADELLGWAAASPLTRPQRLWIASLAVLPGLLIGVVKWGQALATRPALAWINTDVAEDSFLRLADALPDGAHVYAPFGSAPLVLLFESPRGVKVLFDPRNDCYSAEVARGAFDVEWGPPGKGPRARPVANYLEKYGTEYAFERMGGTQARELARDAGWESWKRDGPWMAFHRTVPGPTPSPGRLPDSR